MKFKIGDIINNKNAKDTYNLGLIVGYYNYGTHFGYLHYKIRSKHVLRNSKSYIEGYKELHKKRTKFMKFILGE